MSKVREALREKGITDRNEQDKELWIMAHDILYGPLAEIFEALDEPHPYTREGDDG